MADEERDRQDAEAGAGLAQAVSIGGAGIVLGGFVLWVLVQMAPLTASEESLGHMAIGFLLVALGGALYATVQKLISDF